jgi:hypothetical protein
LYGLPWHGVLLAYLISGTYSVEDGEAAASRDGRKSKYKIGFGKSESSEPSVLEPKSVTAAAASTSEGSEAML